MPQSKPGWVTVATYGATFEAELAAGRLESVGIPSRIDQRGAVGLFGPGHQGRTVRGVALLVPADKLDDAMAALDLA
jgi:hypothetical protein